jgi:hypothetical protein
VADAGKYGDVSFEHIPDDEPVFVVRARDKLAIPTLTAYIDLATRDEEVSEEFTAHLAVIRDDFEFWQKQNETKAPD